MISSATAMFTFPKRVGGDQENYPLLKKNPLLIPLSEHIHSFNAKPKIIVITNK